ncbi:type II CAAX endopeptidase family protein [Bengtsoniella intestinalis]|uniref:CPBP family intramembrane glutamic endopeptidase n=1 Tax=Bengtsoniella intestinalis TaxID=3073143 RepID=UPI00391FB54D
MAKRGGGVTYMTSYEKMAGALLFVLYIIIMPMVVGSFFGLLEGAFSTSFSEYTRSAIYYYGFLILTILVFHRFLGDTSARFTANVGNSLQIMLTGLVLFYGLNQVFHHVMSLFGQNYSNLINSTVFSQVEAPTPLGWLIIVLVAPFVEEVLFRGWVFGLLKGKNNALAYVVSIGLYALMTAWAFCYNAVVYQDFSTFFPLLQVAISGWALAWVYDKTGTLWTAIGLHALINFFTM